MDYTQWVISMFIVANMVATLALGWEYVQKWFCHFNYICLGWISIAWPISPLDMNTHQGLNAAGTHCLHSEDALASFSPGVHADSSAGTFGISCLDSLAAASLCIGECISLCYIPALPVYWLFMVGVLDSSMVNCIMLPVIPLPTCDLVWPRIGILYWYVV